MTSKAKNKKQYDMHLILNTHWDREYRWSFRETQMRLMEAGDILIDTMEHDPRFKYFHPDSQASFLDDYLELRPENRERVKTLVADAFMNVAVAMMPSWAPGEAYLAARTREKAEKAAKRRTPEHDTHA